MNTVEQMERDFGHDVERNIPEYQGTLYTPYESALDGNESDYDDNGDEDEDEEEDYTVVSSMERPAQSLNLNGISASEFFFEWPCVTNIIFENNTSEARDLDANERNFLSMLRLTLYLGLVGVVVLFNTRLPTTGDNKEKPDKNKVHLNEKIAISLGIVFCVLSIFGLWATVNNYISTIGGYAKQRSVVQTTPLAQLLVLASGAAIFAANIIFLMYN